MQKRRRMPRDPSKLGKAIIDIATGAAEPEPNPDEVKDPAAVSLGRRGGLKGGKARAAKMTQKARVLAARKAARIRWSRK